jgi:hypothetical protein
MIAGEARAQSAKKSWWRRALLWMAEEGGVGAEEGESPGEPDPADGDPRTAWGGSKAPSRDALAALAYPALSRRASRYRRALYALLAFLVLWLILTCMLSWDVATGNSLLRQVTDLDARITTLEGATAQDQSTATSRAASQRRSSDDLNHALLVREVALDNLDKWMKDRDVVRRFLIARMGGKSEGSTATPSTRSISPERRAPAEQANAAWAAALLGILAGNILPIFYGLLGAGASVVRNLSGRMRDSVLAPRDILLAYVQLALGAVVGACVGLFVNSEGGAAAGEEGLLSAVPLSASALCFVAGFGVEGVFQALESLTRRVFNTEPPRPAATV